MRINAVSSGQPHFGMMSLSIQNPSTEQRREIDKLRMTLLQAEQRGKAIHTLSYYLHTPPDKSGNVNTGFNPDFFLRTPPDKKSDGETEFILDFFSRSVATEKYLAHTLQQAKAAGSFANSTRVSITYDPNNSHKEGYKTMRSSLLKEFPADEQENKLDTFTRYVIKQQAHNILA
jgi:hypothetical protein